MNFKNALQKDFKTATVLGTTKLDVTLNFIKPVSRVFLLPCAHHADQVLVGQHKLEAGRIVGSEFSLTGSDLL